MLPSGEPRSARGMRTARTRAVWTDSLQAGLVLTDAP